MGMLAFSACFRQISGLRCEDRPWRASERRKDVYCHVPFHVADSRHFCLTRKALVWHYSGSRAPIWEDRFDTDMEVRALHEVSAVGRNWEVPCTELVDHDDPDERVLIVEEDTGYLEDIVHLGLRLNLLRPGSS